MKITDACRGEHGEFYAQFDRLDQATPGAATLEQVQTQAARVTASLMEHANLEDELLFTALEPHLGTQFGPLAIMRMEHDEIERALGRLSAARDLAEAEGLVQQAGQVAREHFSKEDNVLFELAERLLDAQTLVQMGRQWSQRRTIPVN